MYKNVDGFSCYFIHKVQIFKVVTLFRANRYIEMLSQLSIFKSGANNFNSINFGIYAQKYFI